MERYEIHCHSIYSNERLLDAIASINDLVDYGIEIGLKGLCITDHGCVSGWIDANQKQLELDKKGIDFKIGLGEEGYLTDTRDMGQKYFHCIWIAKDKIGAKQIRRMSSIANLNSYTDRGMERVPLLKSELEMIVKKDPGHIIVTSACLGGELSSNILIMERARMIGDTQTAESAKQKIIDFVLWMKKLFADDFYMEIAPAASEDQIIVNKKMVELSKVFNVKMVIGSDAHYLKKEDRFIHESFLNSKGGERETAQFYQYAYLQNEKEIIKNLEPSIVDIYSEMCANSMEIYDKITKYSLKHPQKIPSVEVEDYPKVKSDLTKYPTLAAMESSDDKIERCWINRCKNKLKEIGKYDDKYLAELEEEAEVKKIVGEKLNTNMFSYPITLSQYIDKFWQLESPVGVGRGSACAALNHYLLNITQLDPLEWDFPFFRYMNRDTNELGDIDLDLAPSKVGTILRYIKNERGEKFNPDLGLTDVEKENLGAVYVCTFGKETSKNAIQTACRGYRTEEYPDGIDVDVAQYLSSLVPIERGFVWSLSDVYYGNEDKGRKPVRAFINEVDQYPNLFNIMLGVENIVSRKGRHASGVLFLDEDPYEFNAFMKTPSGEVVTQWDLHMVEWAGSTKFDFLVTSVEDKILQTIKFLQKDNLIEPDLTLKEAYDKYLHPDVLPIKDSPKVWEKIQKASVLDLFQLDSDIGRQGAKKVRPENMWELSSTNALIRLMTTEKGAETWLERYVRYKNDPSELERDINKYGLLDDEKISLDKYLKGTYGIGLSQEQFMRVVMDSNICNFSLAEANSARRIISKKKMKDIPVLKKEIFEKAKSENLAEYVWDWVAGPGLGYSFSDIHSLSYSFVGYQTAYLATKWNPIYWDTACLVVNSGSLEENEREIVDIYEKEDFKNYSYKDLPDKKGKVKEKNSDYGKIAKAIGTIRSNGVEVSLVNINTSDYSYIPDVANNRILYGLKALSNINGETIEKIKAGRPYKGIKDFMLRCKLNKTAMLNLIKAGAFDEIDENFKGDRRKIMGYFIMNNCQLKNRITLQNFNGLIQHNLIPKDLELEIRIFNFTKYLKAYKKVGKYFTFDNECLNFYQKFLPEYIEELEVINGITCILQTKWDKIYKNFMSKVKTWMADKQSQILHDYNLALFTEAWQNNAEGTLSHWEMQSLCFYHGEHELAHVDQNKYGIVDFNCLNPNSTIDYFFRRGNIQIPIYKLYRIAGTVLDKDDNRCTVTLLTTTGVVPVKFTREYYGMFKKQISQIQPDGTKKVMEKGWFKRGNMLLVTGYRRDDQFIGKTYKVTLGHQLYKIEEVKGSELLIKHERFSSLDAYEEEEYE